MVEAIISEELESVILEGNLGVVCPEKQEMINKVKVQYKINLDAPFVHLYKNCFDLYVSHFLNECESKADFIQVIKGFVVDGAVLEDTVLDDDNVFVLGDTWIYCDVWEDVEWENQG